MPEPGWYDDPESALHVRYWNGSDWTSDRHPKPPTVTAAVMPRSRRSFVATLLLALLLGPLGVHRFYVGKVGTGLLHLVTLGLFGIWTLVDVVLIVVGRFRDADGALVRP